MEMTKKIEKKFYEKVAENGDTEAVAHWAASMNNDNECRIWEMDDFNEITQNIRPYDLARKIYHGNFSPYDDYFAFDAYDVLQTFSSGARALEWAGVAEAVEWNAAAFFDEFPEYLDEFGAYFGTENKEEG